jgi:hypothetical protein
LPYSVEIGLKLDKTQMVASPYMQLSAMDTRRKLKFALPGIALYL